MDWLPQLDFTHRALIAGLGIAVLAGPLGSLILWRRMAYFGDTLAHSTLLGLCLGMLLHINLYIGLVAVSLLVAIILVSLVKQNWLASDTVLGILSHTTLATGLIVATTVPGIRIELLSYLFGDILSVNMIDIFYILRVDLVALIILWGFWPKFLSTTVDKDLAKVEGLPVDVINWMFIIMLAFVFAFAIKIVGVLLITALLIIPPAAARRFARSPEQMVLLASIFGAIAVGAGFMASLNWNWPTGPAIVVMATLIFFLSLFTKLRSHA